MTMRRGVVVAVALVMLLTVPGLADEVLTVPANGNLVFSSALTVGRLYEIRVEGTYVYNAADHLADAEWKYWALP